ncbi:uncharacterized protein LDX57_000274 [Aspergillus melleus]|uniref:uncharacterized protein n=1 Tax=Aspergillus melleus TaxID=138277 RepID=UPI001E8E0E5B|nr:uncharacterized protein LDX57_000274 [Aspergillus melleus]KAH8422520.1 hypothetical protein LDX57_000274 [Aspergillus melleus]
MYNVLLPTLLLFLTTAITSTATPIDLTQRDTCTTLAPSTISILNLSTPDTPNLGTQLTLTRTTNPSRNTQTVSLTFTNISTTATGCILQLALPELTAANEIASGPATQADIWKTTPWEPANAPTWNRPPVKDQMVATARFPTERTNEAQVSWLASGTCVETMSFLVELSGWQDGEGNVDFVNRVDGGEGDLGFRLVYGC